MVTENKTVPNNHVYLGGPMRGLPQSNYPAFTLAAKLLRDSGHTVSNPAENFDGDTGRELAEYMKLDIASVLACDAVVFLPGWSESWGANTEALVAHLCGKNAYLFKLGEDQTSYELEEINIEPPVLPYATDPRPLDESVAVEADKLVHGPRRGTYGHPLDDYTKVAGMLNALFRGLLVVGKQFEPEHMPLILECIKLSREMNLPKRDNRVDGCGYWLVKDMIHSERARREEAAVKEFGEGLVKALEITVATDEECEHG